MCKRLKEIVYEKRRKRLSRVSFTQGFLTGSCQMVAVKDPGKVQLISP